MMNRLNIHCRLCSLNVGRNPFLQTRLLHNSTNHYDTLGVKKTASKSEIKNAFIKLSKKMHPDVNPNDPKSTANFAKINEAYTVLSKPSSRRDYDLKLSQKVNPSAHHVHRKPSHPNVYRRQRGYSEDFSYRQPPRSDRRYESWYEGNGPYSDFNRREEGPKMEEEDKYNDTHKIATISAIVGAAVCAYFILLFFRFRRGIQMKEASQKLTMEEFQRQEDLNSDRRQHKERWWPSTEYK